ncbi:MAG: hypothetical protein LBB84_02875 [Tannerellaceae bacterium]|nr:hypothetical protein [Tannerellaceae bacterium]
MEATQPVYVYHRSGLGEEGVALLPSVYSIGQTQLSFYQVGNGANGTTLLQRGFLIFRTDTQGSFTISYNGGAPAPLALIPLNIPNVADWKIARFNYNNAPTAGQVIKVQSTQSAFALGYIVGDAPNNDSYGYFSAFGDFEFAGGDTTYMCASSVVLQGGYAKSYTWTYPNSSVVTGPSFITATEEGLYTLEMDQDPNTVIATTYVKRVNAGTVSPAYQMHCSNTTPIPLTVSGTSAPQGTQYQWQYSYDNATWTNINNATSVNYTPPAPTQDIWYRRGMTSNLCGIAYTESVKVCICMVPVNPHLRTQVF